MRDLREMSIGEFLEKLSSGDPTPGGGTAAALAGALAAGLLSMAASVGLKRKPDDKSLRYLRERASAFVGSFLELAREDAEAYAKVAQAYKLPKGTSKEKEERKRKIQETLIGAAEIPLRTAETAVEVLEAFSEALSICPESVMSDILTGSRLAAAAARGALYNVDVNCTHIKSPQELLKFREKRPELEKLVREQEGAIAEAEKKIKKWLGEEDSNLH